MLDDIAFHSDHFPSTSTDFDGTIFVLSTPSRLELDITPLDENPTIIHHESRGLQCERHFSEI